MPMLGLVSFWPPRSSWVLASVLEVEVPPFSLASPPLLLFLGVVEVEVEVLQPQVLVLLPLELVALVMEFEGVVR